MATSSCTHRLRRGTAIYATGFPLTPSQLEDMARIACPPKFFERHGHDPVFALKWYVSRHKYQLLDGDHPGEYIFAVHFFPWCGDPQDAPLALRTLSDEQRKVWHEMYGRHAGTDYEERTVKYPTHGAVAAFLEKRLQQVIAEANLWDLLEPVVPACVRSAAATAIVS
ncbi:hypothetical protein C8F04DRAFT_1117422 [Mycena alexandri]|uniref:Uncharacterized protein n=1 Tax=Mycena alexandri TaxID=1745969 RepID=A0AAD6WVM3_9AGAR|nr:hypothetical protein C8F04DRAFT_1117422 [Mycena alexandri]